MTAELTFELPGTTRVRARAAGLVDASGMSAEQRAALAALIHVPAGRSSWHSRVADLGIGIAWMLVTACALAWALVIAVELAPDMRLARSIAMPHVVEVATPSVPVSAGLQARRRAEA